MTKTRMMKVDPTGDHRLAILGEHDVRLILVKGGERRAYLWIGDKDDRCIGHISGATTLRALAEGILAELDGN